jgi:flagellar basal-body rod protein FlgB
LVKAFEGETPMLEKLEITRMAQAMAAHAGGRMAVVASNVAHADTPGYKAQDLPDFAASYAEAEHGAMRATRSGHQHASTVTTALPHVVPGAASPNGNTVSLEGEMVKSAEVRQQHDMALSIYRSTSNILRSALGRG